MTEGVTGGGWVGFGPTRVMLMGSMRGIGSPCSPRVVAVTAATLAGNV